jgi:Family of unknown function (DUF6527)
VSILLYEKHYVDATDQPTGEETLYFWCPGCRSGHMYRIKRATGDTQKALWSWNGNKDKPTFTPSLLYYTTNPTTNQRESICHLFVTDGMIIYCVDSQHHLAGKTIPMVDLDLPYEQRERT